MVSGPSQANESLVEGVGLFRTTAVLNLGRGRGARFWMRCDAKEEVWSAFYARALALALTRFCLPAELTLSNASYIEDLTPANALLARIFEDLEPVDARGCASSLDGKTTRDDNDARRGAATGASRWIKGSKRRRRTVARCSPAASATAFTPVSLPHTLNGGIVGGEYRSIRVLWTTAAVQGEDLYCSDQWKNMINNVTAKMWGIFDETGIFLALCHHGFILLLCDMVRSGELVKYPMAIIDELLDCFPKGAGLGYDIGRHMEATSRNSKLGPKAQEAMLKMLVGAFHGHAHNRLCQLQFLASYIEGLGLEDLEGCEQFFSESNSPARSVRYASRFHRQQDITTYIKHFDSMETYTNLSKFLCKN
ncbi:hypothetical protein B0H17DRAFT_1208826 [Mycena rosella]|uniref:Uncharacterized protein n=1 Tax=Mycena rosella TaxID=1033263 RepID=A0AAD7D0B2_MYCRO|nr:hypothetical protein B0H17DRAFT_1208826 [Mycena rosella]